MRIELVVFDMAGTTVHDGDGVSRCFREALATAHIEVSDEEVKSVRGYSKPLAIRKLVERHHSGDALEAERIHRSFVELLLAYYREDPAIREVDGAGEAFRLLHNAGVLVALDTGFNRLVANTIIDRLGWQAAGLLDASVTSDEVVHGRPEPDMIFRAMELTGVTQASAVAKAGDTPADLQQGSNAGCGVVIGVCGGSHTRTDLERWPHTHLVGSVAEVPAVVGAG